MTSADNHRGNLPSAKGEEHVTVTIKQCGVRKDTHSLPIPTHEASWSVSDDTPDGAERLSCDDHLSWVLNWDGVANTVFALVAEQ